MKDSLLSDVRVLELGRLLPSAITTSKLADLGADVIKIERPPRGDPLRLHPPFLDGTSSLLQLMFDRNKRSVAIDYESPEGLDLLRQLVSTADVLLENGRPGWLEPFGLDAPTLRGLHPRLVYCSLTGYGATGPFAGFPAHGMNIDAAASMIDVVWADGRPEVNMAFGFGVELGAMHAALAIAAALARRHSTGGGCYLDISCFEAAVAASRDVIVEINPAVDGRFPSWGRGGLDAHYNVYGTKDGQVLLLGMSEPKFWLEFCRLVGHPEWIDRTDTEALRSDIQAVIGERPLDDWQDRLTRADIPCSLITRPEQVEQHPQVLDRQLVIDGPEGDTARYVRLPVIVDGKPPGVERRAPLLGEHTIAVIESLGHSPERAAELAARWVP